MKKIILFFMMLCTVQLNFGMKEKQAIKAPFALLKQNNATELKLWLDQAKKAKYWGKYTHDEFLDVVCHYTLYKLSKGYTIKEAADVVQDYCKKYYESLSNEERNHIIVHFPTLWLYSLYVRCKRST